MPEHSDISVSGECCTMGDSPLVLHHRLRRDPNPRPHKKVKSRLKQPRTNDFQYDPQYEQRKMWGHLSQPGICMPADRAALVLHQASPELMTKMGGARLINQFTRGFWPVLRARMMFSNKCCEGAMHRIDAGAHYAYVCSNFVIAAMDASQEVMHVVPNNWPVAWEQRKRSYGLKVLRRLAPMLPQDLLRHIASYWIPVDMAIRMHCAMTFLKESYPNNSTL